MASETEIPQRCATWMMDSGRRTAVFFGADSRFGTAAAVGGAASFGASRGAWASVLDCAAKTPKDGAWVAGKGVGLRLRSVAAAGTTRALTSGAGRGCFRGILVPDRIGVTDPGIPTLISAGARWLGGLCSADSRWGDVREGRLTRFGASMARQCRLEAGYAVFVGVIGWFRGFAWAWATLDWFERLGVVCKCAVESNCVGEGAGVGACAGLWTVGV